MSKASGDSRQRREAISRPAKITLGVVVLFAAVAGGFLLGRGSADTSTAATGQCGDARAEIAKLYKEQQQPSDGLPAAVQPPAQATLTMMNVVLQNPDCFNAEERATAQTTKDQIATDANNAAVSAAADKIAACAAGTALSC
jgi:hypothetical protein